jgi:pyruvoyl-dependent arginine decarboxylase (PvlArgDC)
MACFPISQAHVVASKEDALPNMTASTPVVPVEFCRHDHDGCSDLSEGEVLGFILGRESSNTRALERSAISMNEKQRRFCVIYAEPHMLRAATPGNEKA